MSTWPSNRSPIPVRKIFSVASYANGMPCVSQEELPLKTAAFLIFEAKRDGLDFPISLRSCAVPRGVWTEGLRSVAVSIYPDRQNTYFLE